MSERHRTLLGFDYGTKRIGVAVGQQLTRSATPIETVAVRDVGPDWEAVTRLIAAWQPGALVVGLPRHEDGSEHAMTHAARCFSNQLRRRYHLPVHTIDEYLSSYAARHEMADFPVKAKKADTDKVAAQLILQTWLEEHPTDDHHDL